MNINEQLLDLLLKRDLLLQRVSNGLSKEVALYYTDLIKQAINTIKDYDEITIVKMNKIIKEINSRIEFNYEEQLSSKFQELGVVEATYIPAAINGLIGVNIVDKLLPEPLIQRILNNSYLADGLTIAESFEKLNDNLKNTFQSQIRLSVLNGDTNQQIVKTLKPILNEFTTNKIDSLVKTSVSTVANNTRMEIYKENEDIFKGYEHQSVLDKNTTYGCAARDGAYWDLNKKGLNELGLENSFKVPPLHFRCRSLLLPILKTFRELGIDLDEVTGLTRSSIDGELPRETNFDKWFSSKDKAFQESYLGKGRYELYKDGKINLSDLVNQKGETLAIKDLNKVSGVAKAVNVPKISFGYGGKFDKYVEDIRDEAKIVIDKLPKPNEILTKGALRSSSYYSPSKKLTNDGKIGSLILSDKSKEKEKVFLHEYGHHIDYIISKNAINGTMIIQKSMDKSFIEARTKDIEHIKEMYKGKSIFDTLKEKWKKDADFAGASDIFDSLSLGVFYDKYSMPGHGARYYNSKGKNKLNNKNSQQTEIFANLFEAYSTGGRTWANIIEHYPNQSKVFEDTIKGFINE